MCEKMTKNLNYDEVGESLVMRKKVPGLIFRTYNVNLLD